MYQILRLQKIKSVYSLRRSMAHTYRDQATPNADPARLAHNQMVGAKTASDALGRYQARLGTVKGAVRKNAVYALEYLVTASPEWFDGKGIKEQNTYFNEALKWLKEQYGAENFISAVVHRDEKTPHLCAYFIPLKDNKLNAKHYVGGHRDRLVEMQTDFHNRVSNQFGLERGQHGSKAKHTAVKAWYSMIAEAAELPKMTPLDKIRALVSGDMGKRLQTAATATLESQLLRDRAVKQVKAARLALKRAESVTERLAQVDKLEAALAASEAKAAHYEYEMGSLKGLLEMNRDVIEANTKKMFGIGPEASPPVITEKNEIAPVEAAVFKP
jgi:hypothetical protein